MATFVKNILAVLDAAVDAKVSQLQSISIQNGGKIVEYSNQMLDLVGELESAGHKMLQMKQRRASLKGLSKDFEAAAEAFMRSAGYWNGAVSRLIVRETRLNDLDPKT